MQPLRAPGETAFSVFSNSLRRRLFNREQPQKSTVADTFNVRGAP